MFVVSLYIKSCNLASFPLPFAWCFCLFPHLWVCMFSLLFLIIISGLCAVTSLSVCAAWFRNTVIASCSYSLSLSLSLSLCACVHACVRAQILSCQVSLSIHFLTKWSSHSSCLHNRHLQILLCQVSLSIHFLPKWSSLRWDGHSSCLHNRHLQSVSSFKMLFSK